MFKYRRLQQSRRAGNRARISAPWLAASFLLAACVSAPVAAARALPSIALLNARSCIDESHIKVLRGFGRVSVYDDTTNVDDVRKRLRGAEIAIAQPSLAPLDRDALEGADALKLLVVCSTGYDQVDMQSATRRGILIANTPGYSTEAVAEHTFALLLALVKNIPAGDRSMRRQPFEVDNRNPSHSPFLGVELRGKTLGVVGLGRIGTRVAQIGRGFDMTVLGWDRTPKHVQGVTQTTLEQLLQRSDVVSLHLALNPDTRDLINAERLRLMKPNAVLINTARGELVNEQALADALRAHRIAGAGIDTVAQLSASNPLLKLENVVLTPHSAFYTRESIPRRSQSIVRTVKAFLCGAPINIVNGSASANQSGAEVMPRNEKCRVDATP
jgi:glycerate dehydrogenase